MGNKGIAPMVIKEEQFYLPAKFVPPFGIGDRYCFPDNEIWQISGVSVESLTAHHVKVTVYWRRPLHGNEDPEWVGKHIIGDTNWLFGATAIKLWEI